MDLGCRAAEVSQARAEAPAIAAGQNLRIRRAWPCVADAETILAKEFAAVRDCLGGAETFFAPPSRPSCAGALVSRRKAVTWRRAVVNVTFPALGRPS